MKKILFASFAALSLVACNSSDEKALVKDAATAEVALPADMLYKGTSAMGNRENIATVMKWNDAIISGKVDDAAAYTADSLTVTLADGTHMEMAKDSAIAMLKGWRGSMDSASQQYTTAIAVDNTTVGDEWVVQWITEKYHYKDGKTVEVALSESFLLKDGKIRRILQYEQKKPAAK